MNPMKELVTLKFIVPMIIYPCQIILGTIKKMFKQKPIEK